MDKKFFVQVVNLDAGKVYSLPTLHTDRVEACVCGQNYVRDRQQEDCSDVFYRVLIAKGDRVAEPWQLECLGWVEEQEELELEDVCPEEVESCRVCPLFHECHGNN